MLHRRGLQSAQNEMRRKEPLPSKISKAVKPRAGEARLRAFLAIANMDAVPEADLFELGQRAGLTVPGGIREMYFQEVLNAYRRLTKQRSHPTIRVGGFNLSAEEFYIFRASLRDVFFDIAYRDAKDTSRTIGALVYDTFDPTPEGRIDVDASPWGRFRSALRDAEVERIKHCEVQDCSKFFYAVRQGQKACSKRCNLKRRVKKWRQKQAKYEYNRKLTIARVKGERS